MEQEWCGEGWPGPRVPLPTNIPAPLRQDTATRVPSWGIVSSAGIQRTNIGMGETADAFKQLSAVTLR